MPPLSSSASATLLASLLYLSIFTFLYITQYGPSIPPLQRQHALGFNLGHAYKDLHRVCFPNRVLDLCGILTSFK